MRPPSSPQALKLVHVTTVPETLGFFCGQSEFFRQHGFDIHVASSPSPALDAFSQRENVVAHGVEMPRRITPLFDILAGWRLLRVLMRVHPIIVHAHTPKGGLLGMIASWLARVPVRIYQIHGLPYMTARGWKRVLLQITERISCLLAHQVLCVSESIRSVAITAGITTPARSAVLGKGSINGIDGDERFNPARFPTHVRIGLRERQGIPAAGLVVGFVGRLVVDKGINELLEAWTALRDEFPDAHLLLVGPFEDGDRVPRAVEQELRRDPRIHLTGFVTDPTSYFAVMDVFVLPSHREGFGLAALEAAAFEIPVVATRIPGCVDAVQDRITGTLIPVGDPVALARTIRMYLADPGLRRSHGRAGRSRVLRDFRQQDIWIALNQEYCRLLQAKGVLYPPPIIVAEAAQTP